MRILIIEDHHDIAANIGDFLEIQGHLVDFAVNGEQGLNLATTENFDLIILDINLPRMDGFSVCQKLRNEYQSQIPVLMLTARAALADKIKGFEAGAWDYLVKPFALEELMLRINALALRKDSNQSKTLKVGTLVLDITNWQVSRDERPVEMHKACLQILELLMRSSPNIVPRKDLEYLLWGEDPPDSNPLRTHMHELRSKLDKPFDYPLIQTVRGLGFKLVQKEVEESDEI
jgi:DNA-binding response OmpR family regulator